MHTYTELIQEGSDIFYKTMAKISKIMWNVMSTKYEIIFRVFLLYFMSSCWKKGYILDSLFNFVLQLHWFLTSAEQFQARTKHTTPKSYLCLPFHA